MAMPKPRPEEAAWQPPFCPNPKCKFHNGYWNDWPFKKNGFYHRMANPKRIQRFTCQHCHRSFSTQTFSTSYWQKMPWLDRLIFMKTVGCMANRQIARDLGISPSTIDRRLSRLGRHCLLFHARLLSVTQVAGPFAIDGFETFEFSQYYPFHHNLAVEIETGFFIFFNDSELRRKGRMTDYQRKRRAELEKLFGRPDPRAVENGMLELLQVCMKDLPSAVIRSDDHNAYRRAIKRLQNPNIVHEVTHSSVRRNRKNRLFEINALDLLIRHSGSNHKRETIAFSKRRQASAERLAILMVWRNMIKKRWERGCAQTSAMLKGLVDHRLTVDEVLAERLFRTHADMPASWAKYYDRAVETRALEVNRRHELKYAY